MIPIGKSGFVSWQSDSPLAVLALIMLMLLLFTIVIVAVIGCLPGTNDWTGKVAQILGQGVLTIVGAIIGSTATNKIRTKR